jgi:hypothetical protein
MDVGIWVVEGYKDKTLVTMEPNWTYNVKGLFIETMGLIGSMRVSKFYETFSLNVS